MFGKKIIAGERVPFIIGYNEKTSFLKDLKIAQLAEHPDFLPANFEIDILYYINN